MKTNNIFENIEALTSNFNFDSLFTKNEKTKEIKINNIQLSGSSLAVNISKLSIEADNKFNRKVKSSYASNYEKGLITIFEKNNGEI